MKKTFFSAKTLAKLGLFIALMIVLQVTRLGMIPIGPINVTTLHIPVILAGVLFGTPFGVIMGLAFGFLSLFNAVQGLSGPLSYAIMNPLVSVLPRLLFGLGTGLVADVLRKRKGLFKYAVPAFFGSLINTFAFLGMLYILYAEGYATATGIPTSAALGAIAGVGFVNGLPEAIVAALITTAIAKAYELQRHRSLSRARDEQ